MSFTASALLVSWAAIAVLGLALAGVLARVHRLEEIVAPGPQGADPSTALDTELSAPLAPGPQLLVLGDRGCGPCERAAAAVADLVARQQASVMWRDEHPRAFTAFGVSATPHAVVVDDRRHVVASAPVGSPERLAEVRAEVDRLLASAR